MLSSIDSGLQQVKFKEPVEYTFSFEIASTFGSQGQVRGRRQL
jgi:hypothetical protein